MSGGLSEDYLWLFWSLTAKLISCYAVHHLRSDLFDSQEVTEQAFSYWQPMERDKAKMNYSSWYVTLLFLQVTICERENGFLLTEVFRKLFNAQNYGHQGSVLGGRSRLWSRNPS